jgi:hypothetical protein
MKHFFELLGFIIAWSSKPKKGLLVRPFIRPCRAKRGSKVLTLWEVASSFWVHGVRVPKGFKSDLRSGGVWISYILGSEASDPYVVAQCIGHDYLYNAAVKVYKVALSEQDKVKKQQAMDMFREADNWFYDALRENNRRFRCKLFFWGVRAYSTVYYGFWRWFIIQKEIPVTKDINA